MRVLIVWWRFDVWRIYRNNGFKMSLLEGAGEVWIGLKIALIDICGRSLHNTNQVLCPPIVYITCVVEYKSIRTRVCKLTIRTALVRALNTSYCTTEYGYTVPHPFLDKVVSLVNMHTTCTNEESNSAANSNGRKIIFIYMGNSKINEIQ